MVDIVPYSSVYPHVSLAPGQRFAAKGAYVARVSAAEKPVLEPVSGWLTP